MFLEQCWDAQMSWSSGKTLISPPPSRQAWLHGVCLLIVLVHSGLVDSTVLTSTNS